MDWVAHGLATEGERAGIARAGGAARLDVVTCALDERVGAVRERVAASPYRFALVTSRDGVLLGRLREATLVGDPDQVAADVMEAGPSTVRPDKAIEALRERLIKKDLTIAIVTTPEGRLLGVVCRSWL